MGSSPAQPTPVPDAEGAAGPELSRRSALRRMLPVGVALGLLAFVLSRVDFKSFWAAIAGIDIGLYALYVVAFNALLLLADALATRYVYASSVAPVRYRDLVIFRAASYLPSLLNHHVGQAWLIFFMSRVYRVSAWSVMGATLLIYVTTLGSLYLMLAVSWLLQSAPAPWLGSLVLGLTALGMLYLIMIWFAPARLRNKRAMLPLIRAGVAGHLKNLLFRLPHTLILWFGMWLAYYFFEVRIPLLQALVVIPPILIVAALPVTPQGMGTRELVALELLTPFVAGSDQERAARIAAASLVLIVSVMLLQVAISPLCMREAYRRLARAGSQAKEWEMATSPHGARSGLPQ